ncbi:sugar epimerase [Ammoniphilus oxalaticus]|uniref:Sugar epimerase n=1 Tax=Ammoniphilus oxalaticus TaxID=66863 RepID=A0A419SNQ9_9BACL|nr:SDR family oxidoreductase [Ammoniphilus oxalaticus]RKD25851.1 sugar epimerase [Ammoniphilus oxalaticus]
MKTLIIGANGQIGQLLVQKIQQTNGLTAVAMVRKEEQAATFKKQGVETVVVDLEHSVDQIAAAAKGVDAIVFTAGSGGHTGADKTMLVDLDGAIKSMEAAQQAGVKRYIMVSAIGVHHRDKWLPRAPHYSAAKHYADRWLEQSGLDYTIVRPGPLTNDPGTGQVSIAVDLERASIPREDVAATIVAALKNNHTIGKSFDLVGGDTLIEDALNRFIDQ